MSQQIENIRNIFGVDWNTVIYKEMNVPVYSCIAFYMYLEVLQKFPLPWSVDDQGLIYNDITDKPRVFIFLSWF